MYLTINNLYMTIRCGSFFYLMVLIIFCGCQKQKNNPKSNYDLEMQILMLSNRVSLTEKILRYVILKDTSTNVYGKLLSGEYNPRNVLDNKNLEFIREQIDTLNEDIKTSKYPKIDLDNRSIIYGVDTSIGNLLIIVEKIISENGSLNFYVRLINPTSIEIISGQFTIYCDTESESGFKRKTNQHHFNNLKSGESIVFKLGFENTNTTNILETRMLVAARDLRFIDK